MLRKISKKSEKFPLNLYFFGKWNQRREREYFKVWFFIGSKEKLHVLKHRNTLARLFVYESSATTLLVQPEGTM